MSEPTTELIELEHEGWRALSADGDAAASFYGEVLARQVLMLLPGGIVIDDRGAAIESMGGAPWSAFELSDERVHALTDTSAVVAYRARARRDEHDYVALVASTYVREDGAWRMAIHQQTPV